MGYATGKYAKAISDRSGVSFPYKEMVKEWTGALADAVGLRDARPQEQHVVFASIGRGADAVFLSNTMQPATQINDLIMDFTIGTVTVL